MKKYISHLILGTLFAFTSVSSYGEVGEKGPFFWEIKKKGEEGGKTSYILGTLHAGVALEELQCSGKILSHLEDANALFVEHFMPTMPEMMRMLIQQEQMKGLSPSAPGFKSLSAKSQNALKEKFSSIVKKWDLEIKQIENVNLPVLMVISGFMCLSNFPSIEDNVIKIIEKHMDRQAMEIAHTRAIPQIYLDDKNMAAEGLLTIISQAENSVLVEGIENIISSYEKNCTPEKLKKNYEGLLFIEELIDPYKAGAGVMLRAAEARRERGYSEEQIEAKTFNYKQNILKVRNELWFPKIKQAHQEHGNIFVAAGLAHFTEAHNLLDMLKEDGFSVKRYNRNCMVE